MATARAIASGNWSATSTWNGGVLPGNGDTVYANNFTVTIDQNVNIGGANNPTVNAGSFVSGQWYQITSVGTTSFTGIGAVANTVGVVFLATGVGSGTGTAKARATITTVASTPAGAAVGGSFVMAAAYNINTNIRGNNTCLSITASSGNIVISDAVIYGSVSGGPGLLITGAANVRLVNCDIGGKTDGYHAYGITFSSTGSLVIENSFISADESSTGNNNAHGILANSTGALQCSNCTITGGGNLSRGIFNTSTGSVNLQTCTISTILSGLPGVENSSTGSIILNNCTLAANAVNNTSNGTLQATSCTFTAANGTVCVSSTNANAINRFSGTFISSPNGTQPINATRWILNSSPTASYIQHALDGVNGNSFVRYYTADNNLGQANPTDVRSGVSYASGNLTGRLTVPARGSVALSVNYGPSMPFTATVSGTTATATLAYSYPLVVGDQITVTGSSNTEWNSSYTIASVVSGTSVSFVVPATHSATAGTGALMQTTGTAVLDPAAVASAVWGAAGRTITGGVVDTLTNAPSVPSASAIASQVRTELSVELARVDQNISSRLAAADYTAPSAAPTVVAIRQELDANSTKLANLDATVSSRLATSGYTAPTSAPSVADIRTELAVELGRLDASVSSRLASASYTAPTTPPTAAQIATAVEGSLLNEADGQAVLNALVSAIGNTNLSEVSLVAAVRADLERTGGKLDNIPTSSAPSASAVAGAVRTELGVELGRIDAAISSRLAPNGTLATVTTLTNAPTSVTPSDIWSHSSRTLTSASGPTAAEIRQEMDASSTKLANLDAAVSTRATPANVPTSDITAIKTRLDSINVDRVNNTATTNIVGTLLAQANS